MPATPPPHTRLANLSDGATFDVVVLGAGGSGMAAALHAAIEGASVLIVESTGLVGGTTAYAEGAAWVPGTHHAAFVHPSESLNDARRYLDATVGSRSSPRLRDAFLQHGATAIHRLEQHTLVAFRAAEGQPDFHPECAGAVRLGRVLEPLPFDARVLGEDFALLRPPPSESMFWSSPALGGVMGGDLDRQHLQRWHRSFRSLNHVLQLSARHARDRLRHARGTQLLGGNALVGRMLASLRRRNIPILLNTRATSWIGGPQGVEGLMLIHEGVTRRILTRGGVILATGGFNRNPMQRSARLTDVEPEWCPGAPGHTGAALSMAEALGAAYGTGALSNAYWAPVSLRRRRDGSLAPVAHLRQHTHARLMVLDPDGRWLADGGLPHHEVGLQIHDAGSTPCFLVTDAEGMKRHGLGAVGAGGVGLKAALAEGYLRQAADLRDLAEKLEMPAAALQQTVERHPSGSPRPGSPPLPFAPPFYALAVFPGDIAAATGLLTDERARVVNDQGVPIHGLYAAGCDMHSVMGGVLPAPGCILGPALVFAAVAAIEAASRAKQLAGATHFSFKAGPNAPPPAPPASPDRQDADTAA